MGSLGTRTRQDPGPPVTRFLGFSPSRSGSSTVRAGVGWPRVPGEGAAGRALGRETAALEDGTETGWGGGVPVVTQLHSPNRRRGTQSPRPLLSDAARQPTTAPTPRSRTPRWVEGPARARGPSGGGLAGFRFRLLGRWRPGEAGRSQGPQGTLVVGGAQEE